MNSYSYTWGGMKIKLDLAGTRWHRIQAACEWCLVTGVVFRVLHPYVAWKQFYIQAACFTQSRKTCSEKDSVGLRWFRDCVLILLNIFLLDSVDVPDVRGPRRYLLCHDNRSNLSLLTTHQTLMKTKWWQTTNQINFLVLEKKCECQKSWHNFSYQTTLVHTNPQTPLRFHPN